MPFDIKLELPPAGYAISAARDGETVSVQQVEFTSTEDGQHFIERVEGFPDEILTRLPPTDRKRPSQIDHMLAVIARDGSVRAYVNELALHATMVPSRNINAGELLTKDDVVDIENLDIGVQIPPDAGVMFLFSVGWRKGMFYDFMPIAGPNPTERAYLIPTALGQYYCYLLFQERFRLTDADWNTFFASRWFPFAGLRNETIRGLLSHVRSAWDLDGMLEEITRHVSARLPAMLESWRSHALFGDHIDVLDRAAERFLSGDFISCTGLLVPRIEGILRSYHVAAATPSNPSATNLSDSAIVAKSAFPNSLLMPRRFAQYLKQVYFASFEPASPSIDVSRHSVAHGTASQSNFNQKSAVIALLVVHQLFHFRPRAAQPEKLAAAQ